MSKAKRRIKKANVTHLSLCPKGANNFAALYKSLEAAKDDSKGAFEFSTLHKEMEEGLIVSIVYAPEHVDSDGDIASKDLIKQACYDFARNGKGVDICHSFKEVPKNAAFVAESFLIAKGDSRFAGMKDNDGKDVDCDGAWAVVVKVEDENLKKLYRSGEWAGISMGGRAEFEVLEKQDESESFAKGFMEFIKSLAGTRQEPKKETPEDMDIEKLTKAIETVVDKALEAKLAKLLPGKTEEKKDEAPDLDALKKQKQESDAALEKAKAENKVLNDRISAIQKSSNAGAGDPTPDQLKKQKDQEAASMKIFEARMGIKAS